MRARKRNPWVGLDKRQARRKRRRVARHRQWVETSLDVALNDFQRDILGLLLADGVPLEVGLDALRTDPAHPASCACQNRCAL